MNNIIRLTVGVGRVNVANPKDSLEEIVMLLDENSHKDNDIIVFPRLALSSPSSGSLSDNALILEASKQAINSLREYSHKTNGYILAGFVTQDVSRPVSAMAVLHKGSVISYLATKEDNFPIFKSQGLSDTFCPESSIIQCGDARVGIYLGKMSELTKGAVEASDNHCDILLVPAYEPMTAGKTKKMVSLAKELSASLGIAISIINGGIGDTSSPYLYSSYISVHENGRELAAIANRSSSFLKTVDIDLDILRGGRHTWSEKAPVDPIYSIPENRKTGLLRAIHKNPFLPADIWEKEEYIAELFAFQVRSLAARMTNTGIQNLVLGVSGGIDSTSALMVAVAACDYLELPRTNVLGITLPGLGTSDTTYYNALALLEQLDVKRKDISIRPAVLQHFQDIGHMGETDTAYENAQARERTQILMDMANMVGGLVVGTGDLSEIALGFATFGGDHLSNYSVNSCMTKTMLREQLKHIISTEKYESSNQTIQDILDTPVSPELLPPSDSGEILQKTEDILGPYELHEFFLYYFVGYKMKPSKIYKYACIAFEGKQSAFFIKEKLTLFLRKFCTNQFKRSCSPDSASITDVNLLGVNYSIASDLDPTALIKDLDNVD